MKTKLKTFFYGMVLSYWPCLWCSGGRVVYLSPDFRKLTVRIKLNTRTRNVVNVIFGGSMYASTDPMYFLMLMQILGKDYVVWDKGCTVRFKRPAKVPLFAHFEITDEMLADVVEQVKARGETSFTWSIAFRDAGGAVYSEFDKVLYLARKDFYKRKLASRAAPP